VSPLAGRTTLTPLVGREQEVGLLLDRWEQVSDFRLRGKARQMGVGAREFLRFAKLSGCDRSRV